MALNDFDYIATKVRRVTGRPSTNQLTDPDLRDYINSFLVYDLPLHSRLFYNRQIYSFQLTPSVSVYSIDAIKNTYSNFEPPVYIDGMQIRYIQNEETFFQVYPRIKYSMQISTGTAAIGVGPYTGTFTYVPIDFDTVVISTISVGGASMVATCNNAGVIAGDATGNVNLLTGVVTALTWTAAVGVGEAIYMSAKNYVVGRPYAMLYFNNEFRFWPFPDRAYTCEMVAYPNLTAMTGGGGALFPGLNQWADVIAYGAAIKIFTDNLDLESVSKVQPLFDQSKRLAERRTLKQLSTQRVETIYSDESNYPTGFFGYPYS